MKGLHVKRLELAGVETKEEMKMDCKCLKVMVKNLTDDDIYVGIGDKDDVIIEDSTLIKSNCYQIVFINDNKDCARLFDTLVVFGSGSGTIECVQILY